MPNNRIITLLLLMCSPLLASCATAIEGSTQQVYFKTIGADDALCSVQTGSNDFRYDVRPPQSLWVQKSRKPMFVTCTAPGNRLQNATVESGVAGMTFLNTLNGGLGGGVDATSGAMYKYPEEVIIDFSNIPAKDQYLPAYENYGALDSRKQGIEYMGPDTPTLQGDKEQVERFKKAYEEAARIEAEQQAFEAEKERRINALDGGFYGDKTVPKVSSEEDSTSLNESDRVVVAPLSEAAPEIVSQAPVPLTPKIPEDTAVAVPQAPKLGEPIFPSSTSF